MKGNERYVERPRCSVDSVGIRHRGTVNISGFRETGCEEEASNMIFWRSRSVNLELEDFPIFKDPDEFFLEFD